MFWNQNSSTMRYNKVKRDWLLLLDIFLMYADILELAVLALARIMCADIHSQNGTAILAQVVSDPN